MTTTRGHPATLTARTVVRNATDPMRRASHSSAATSGPFSNDIESVADLVPAVATPHRDQPATFRIERRGSPAKLRMAAKRTSGSECGTR
jgi:hypothetical protein